MEGNLEKMVKMGFRADAASAMLASTGNNLDMAVDRMVGGDGGEMVKVTGGKRNTANAALNSPNVTAAPATAASIAASGPSHTPSASSAASSSSDVKGKRQRPGDWLCPVKSCGDLVFGYALISLPHFFLKTKLHFLFLTPPFSFPLLYKLSRNVFHEFCRVVVTTEGSFRFNLEAQVCGFKQTSISFQKAKRAAAMIIYAHATNPFHFSFLYIYYLLFLLPFSMSQVRKDSSPFASLPKVCTSSPSNSRLLLISPSKVLQ